MGLLNVDDRFAATPNFTFTAMSIVEAERLRSNANLTGMKGKRSMGGGGHAVYQLEDPCAVFEKIPGTLDFKQQHFQILARRYISSVQKIYIFWPEDIYLLARRYISHLSLTIPISSGQKIYVEML